MRTVTGDAHQGIRVVSVYSTRWEYRYGWSVPEWEGLGLDRPDGFAELISEGLPFVLDRTSLDVDSLSFAALGEGSAIDEYASAESWLFVLSSGQVVAALVLELRCRKITDAAEATVRALENSAYTNINVGGVSLSGYIDDVAERIGASSAIGLTAIPWPGVRSDGHGTRRPPERHQIVFAAEVPGESIPDDELVERILSRRTAESSRRRAVSPIGWPAELNERANALAAVTASTSLLYGQPERLENEILFGVVHVVGTAARLRQIWRASVQLVRKFQVEKQALIPGIQARSDLEVMADQLGPLVLDLAISVETQVAAGPTIALAEVDDFSRTLADKMQLVSRGQTLGRVLGQIERSIGSELIAIDIRERYAQQAADFRRAAVGCLTASIGVPASFLVAFFGINASQVDSKVSVLDLSHYGLVYLLAAGLALAQVAVFLVLHGTIWERVRRLRNYRYRV